MNNAIIVDIDGTLTSDFGGVPNNTIIDLVHRYSCDHDILIITYRPISEAPYTEKWLSDMNVQFTRIWYTTDKMDIYKKYIENKWNVRFILEDDAEIISDFRDIGLQAIEVNNKLLFPERLLDPQ